MSAILGEIEKQYITNLFSDTQDEEDAVANLKNYISNIVGNTGFSINKKMSEKEKTVVRLFMEGSLIDTLQPVFQPIVSSQSHKVLGFEILSRWETTEIMGIPPALVFKILKKYGLLNDYILNSIEVVSKSLEKVKIDFSKVYFTFNVSPDAFSSSLFVEQLVALFEIYLVGKNIKIEVTEEKCLSDMSTLKQGVDYMKSKGIPIVLDDFGIEHSNFERISNFRPEVIKVDRSFILNLHEEFNIRLLSCFMYVAQQMKIGVVVEGVDNINTLHKLSEMGFDVIQGFVYSKPAKIEQIEFVEADNGGLYLLD